MPLFLMNNVSFLELQTINSDVFAWLTVYGTNIDYPVVQGNDNLRYVNTNAKGRHAASGAIFLDYQNCPGFTDFNSIFYGHHMERQAMFGEIGLFWDSEFFAARRYGMLYWDGEMHGIEFFAFIHVDAFDRQIFRAGISDNDERQIYLDRIFDEAINIRNDISITVHDQIIMLSTCSSRSTNGRDILIGKLISEVHDNPFEVERESVIFVIPMIDGITKFFIEFPFWVHLSICMISFSLIFLLLLIICINHKKSKNYEILEREEAK